MSHYLKKFTEPFNMALAAGNVRVTVTVTRDQEALLDALGALQGRSKGSYLRELLDGAEPLLKSLLGSLRVHAAILDGQPDAVRDAVHRVLTGAFPDDPTKARLARELSDHEDTSVRGHAPSEARAERDPSDDSRKAAK